MTWSPLACGIVSGKYDGGIPPYSRASLKVSLDQGSHQDRQSHGSITNHDPWSLGMLCPWEGSVLPNPTITPAPAPQGYQWLKDKILSEEGRRQQAKLKELQAIAERLGCTLPQLAIGKGTGGHRDMGGHQGQPGSAQALLSLLPQPGACAMRASAPSCWEPPTRTS